MDKFIIELPYNTAWLQWVKVAEDGTVSFDYKYPEDLTPYTEPDTNEAYQRGYETAKHECEDCREVRADAEQELADKAYQRGLSDAWAAARKIALNPVYGGYATEELEIIFGTPVTIDVFDLSASEAIEKIQAYEQEQEKIQVGDEMNGKGGIGIITRISDDGNHFNVMWENGSTGYYMMEDFKKTGRHFPEIVELLRKMKES